MSLLSEDEEAADPAAEFVVDWTEFHEYHLVQNPEDLYLRLYVDGAEAARLHIDRLPGDGASVLEGFLVVSETSGEPVVSE